jgi:hypothetical protein
VSCGNAATFAALPRLVTLPSTLSPHAQVVVSEQQQRSLRVATTASHGGRRLGKQANSPSFPSTYPPSSPHTPLPFLESTSMHDLSMSGSRGGGGRGGGGGGGAEDRLASVLGTSPASPGGSMKRGLPRQKQQQQQQQQQQQPAGSPKSIKRSTSPKPGAGKSGGVKGSGKDEKGKGKDGGGGGGPSAARGTQSGSMRAEEVRSALRHKLHLLCQLKPCD